MDLSIITQFLHKHPLLKQYKREAKQLYKDLQQQKAPEVYETQRSKTLMQCQDLIAQHHGYQHWHHLHTSIKNVGLGLFKNAKVIRTLQSILPEAGAWHLGSDLMNHQVFLSDDVMRTHCLYAGDPDTNPFPGWARHYTDRPVLYLNGSGAPHPRVHFERCWDLTRPSDTFKIQDPFLNLSPGALVEMVVQGLPLEDREEKGRGISLVSMLFMLYQTSYCRQHEVVLMEEGRIPLLEEEILRSYAVNPAIEESIRSSIHAWLGSLQTPQSQVILHKVTKALVDIIDFFTPYISDKGLSTLELLTLTSSLEIRLPVLASSDHPRTQARMIHAMVTGWFKAGMVQGLGVSLDAMVTRGLSRPSKVPFRTLWCQDVATPRGWAVVPAQARSLGWRLWMDYSESVWMAPQWMDKEERYSILANMNCQMFGKTKVKEIQDVWDQVVGRVVMHNLKELKEGAIQQDLRSLPKHTLMLQYQNIADRILVSEFKQE